MSSFVFEVSRLVEMIIDKLRVNVIILAFLVTWVIVDFGEKLIHLLHDESEIEPQLIITVLVGLISVGIGGLIAAMVRMFESPQVPANVHEQTVKQMLEDHSRVIKQMTEDHGQTIKQLSEERKQ